MNDNTPAKIVILASTERTGSTLFVNALKDAGIVPAAGEPFNDITFNRYIDQNGAISRSDYLELLFSQRTNEKGIFCVKTHFQHYIKFAEFIPLKNVTFIRIDRKNKVRQAISLLKAFVSGSWRSTTQCAIILREEDYSFESILYYYKQIIDADAQWANYFRDNQIEPATFYYEDFSTGLKTNIAKAVLLITGETLDEDTIPDPTLKKQADDVSDYFYRRFMDDMAKLTSKRQGRSDKS